MPYIHWTIFIKTPLHVKQSLGLSSKAVTAEFFRVYGVHLFADNDIYAYGNYAWASKQKNVADPK